MKEIKLTQGKVALVDDEYFEYLNQFKWYAHKARKTFYAERRVKSEIISMHRVIAQVPKGMQVDHIDHNGLHNLRHNLRICTPSQNRMNGTMHADNTSGFKGVVRDCGKWRAKITVYGNKINLGIFPNPKDAAIAYNEAAIKYFGEFAMVNVI